MLHPSPRAPLVVLALLFVGACPDRSARERRAGEGRTRGDQLTAELVAKERPRYVKVRDRALAYLASLSVDPVELRRQGMKGKKKLVELLDAYVALHRYAKGSLRVQILERFKQAASVTGRPEYHDLATADERQFRQDATSYLRACYLMERMGLSTSSYRAEIARVKPRIDGHLAQRGVHQRMAFRWYYRHFGLELPPLLRAPVKGQITGRRLNPYGFDLDTAYALTHEVFVPFDYGAKLETTELTVEDRAYLRRALEVLTTIHIGQRNVDLVGELLACLRYLGDTDLAAYRDGLSFILSSQRENGSFGDYEQHRAKRGERLELDLYLHTTSVVMDVLPLAFEGPPVRR